VSFWEKHKSALTTGGAILFVLAVAYLVWIRPALSEASELRADIESLKTKLGKSYPRVTDPERIDEPRLEDIQRQCVARRKEYERQLAITTEKLRFPFKTDFPWVDVPRDKDGELAWIPGEYLIKRYRQTRGDVENYHGRHGRSPTTLLPDWLGFLPDEHPDKVKVAEAEDKLRMLALAERVTKLAIDQRVRYVIKVRPAKVTTEAAYSTRTVRNKAGKKVKARVAYGNKFIVNYPVTVEMFGSIDSIMNFFRSVHGEKQFLVIRTFKIVSRDGGVVPEEVMDTAKPGDLFVRIEAACMDFRKPGKGKKDPGKVKTGHSPIDPSYKIPRKPTGY